MVDDITAHEMTRSGRGYAPEDLNWEVPVKERNPKKNITDVEAIELWKNMQSKDYSIKEQLKKIPTHITIMSLLVSSETNWNALMEVLYEVSI